jgi:hypothetical protein
MERPIPACGESEEHSCFSPSAREAIFCKLSLLLHRRVLEQKEFFISASSLAGEHWIEYRSRKVLSHVAERGLPGLVAKRQERKGELPPLVYHNKPNIFPTLCKVPEKCWVCYGVFDGSFGLCLSFPFFLSFALEKRV